MIRTSDLDRVAGGRDMQKGTPTIGIKIGSPRKGICPVPRLGRIYVLDRRATIETRYYSRVL